MTSTAVSESTGKMTLLSRWIPFLLILIAAVAMRQMALDGVKEVVYQGLTEPLLNMNHLMFLLMAAAVSFCITKRPFELLLLIGCAALGVMLHGVWGYIPGARLLSGLSLLFLLLILWNPQRLGRWSSPIIGLTAIAHGNWYGEVIGVESSMDARLIYILALSLVQGSLGIAWGSLMQTLQDKSQSAYEGIEHLLVATAAGTALVYIYWGLFKQF